MSAAKKKQISETLKRRWAEKKAKQSISVDDVERTWAERKARNAKATQPGVLKDVYRANATPYTTGIPVTDSSREKLAVDVIDMVTPHLKSLSTETLVALVERILRP